MRYMVSYAATEDDSGSASFFDTYAEAVAGHAELMEHCWHVGPLVLTFRPFGDHICELVFTRDAKGFEL